MSIRLIVQNKKARHNFHVLESLEVGISLVGTEVKAIRQGKIHLHEAYVTEKRGEFYLQNANISHYEQGNQFNHETTRLRKLLLKKSEIEKLKVKSEKKGLTIIPLKLYFKGRWVKLEIGLCKSKDKGDKRQDLLKQTAKREMDRALKIKLR